MMRLTNAYIIILLLILVGCATSPRRPPEDYYKPPAGLTWPSLESAMIMATSRGSNFIQGGWYVEVDSIDNGNDYSHKHLDGKDAVIRPGYHEIRVNFSGRGYGNDMLKGDTYIDFIAKPGHVYQVVAEHDKDKQEAYFKLNTVSVLEGAESIVEKPFVESQVIQEIRRKAEQGDAVSQLRLGERYLFVDGLPYNRFEANRWFLLAANQGNANAQYYLGDSRMNGLGGAKDENEGVRLLINSYNQGNENAIRYIEGDTYHGSWVRFKIEYAAIMGDKLAIKFKADHKELIKD